MTSTGGGKLKSIRLSTFVSPKTELPAFKPGQVEDYQFRKYKEEGGDPREVLSHIFVAINDGAENSIVLSEEEALIGLKTKTDRDLEMEDILIQLLKERYLKGIYDLRDIEIVYEFDKRDGEFVYSKLKNFLVHAPEVAQAVVRVDPKEYDKVKNFGLF